MRHRISREPSRLQPSVQSRVAMDAMYMEAGMAELDRSLRAVS